MPTHKCIYTYIHAYILTYIGYIHSIVTTHQDLKYFLMVEDNIFIYMSI